MAERKIAPGHEANVIQIVEVLNTGTWRETGIVIAVNGGEAKPPTERSLWFNERLAELIAAGNLPPDKKYAGIRTEVRIVFPMTEEDVATFRKELKEMLKEEPGSK